jgi:hypothetical protein
MKMAESMVEKVVSLVLEKLAGKPPGQIHQAAQAVVTHSQRAALVAQLTRLGEVLAAQLPGLQRATAAAESVNQARAAALDEAGVELREARGAEAAAIAVEYMQRGLLEAELRATSAPAIRELRRKLSELLVAARADMPFAVSHRRFSPIAGKSVLLAIDTTAPATERRVAALVAGMRACDALELLALSDDELDARLAAIEASIPGVTIERIEAGAA